jgi:hypothetical protein
VTVRDAALASAKRWRYLMPHPGDRRVVIHCPEYVVPSDEDRPLAERIFRSFRAMKEGERATTTVYRPASLWADQLRVAYAPMADALEQDDIAPFHFFLANFGAWERYTGVISTGLLRDNLRSPLRRRYLKRAVFERQLEVWRWLQEGERSLDDVTLPRFGNLSGAFIDGVFVDVGSFFADTYGTLLANLVQDTARPVIGELGAGFGKHAYYLLRGLPAFSYVDFDLPETVCLAAYYLMKAFPDKRTLLYGEASYLPEVHRDYELVFMPPFEIEQLGSGSVDLFINFTSLGEMTAEAARNYLTHMCRASRYVFHMNHDRIRNTFEGGEQALLASEYPIAEHGFKLLFRYPDLGHAIAGGGLALDSETFLYLYEREGQ